MNNEEKINRAITIYFNHGNWRMYLKENARRNKNFKMLLEKINTEYQKDVI